MGLGLGIEEPTVEPDHFEPDMIYIEDLFRRWQGVTTHEMLQLIVNNRLQAYISTKDLINFDGIRVHRIQPLRSYQYNLAKKISYAEGIELALATSNIVFKFIEIERFESDKEYLTWRSGTPYPDSVLRCFNSTISDKYTCDRLSKRWRCHSQFVLAALSNHREDGLKYYPDTPIESAEKLINFSVLHDDLMRWEKDNETYDFRKNGKTASDIKEEKLKILAAENATLRAENAALLQRLATRTPSETSNILKTTKASKAKQSKTAENWAESLEKAVALAVECAKSGKQKSKAQHQRMWKNIWRDSQATEPRRDALRAFRRGLPSSLKIENDIDS